MAGKAGHVPEFEEFGTCPQSIVHEALVNGNGHVDVNVNGNGNGNVNGNVIGNEIPTPNETANPNFQWQITGSFAQRDARVVLQEISSGF